MTRSDFILIPSAHISALYPITTVTIHTSMYIDDDDESNYTRFASLPVQVIL